MSLCDRLETELTKATSDREKLMETAISVRMGKAHATTKCDRPNQHSIHPSQAGISRQLQLHY